MRCKVCDYRLWNLATRRCPECGTPFQPSEFEFAPNSVQFQCPHCGQAYYGQDAKGHLVPVEFDCLGCGQHVHMDEMLLLPTEGVDEELTKARKMPWLDRHQRGFLRGWLGTVGKAMASPFDLMRSTPVASPAGQAWRFLVANLFLTLFVALVPMALLRLVVTGGIGVGLGGTSVFLEEAVGVGIRLLILLVVLVVLTAVWGLVAHVLLYLTGAPPGRIGRTYHAICYGSGANILTTFPCLGLYLGWIWWVISATLMLKEAQRVHGARAAIAVIPFPVVTIASVVGLFVWVIMSLVSAMSTMTPATMPAVVPSGQETQLVTNALLNYVRQHAGQWPPHAVGLIADDPNIAPAFVAAQTATFASDVPVGDRTLDIVPFLEPRRQTLLFRSVQQSLPANVIAHRLGDFVFVYHGIDAATGDPGLWLDVLLPDPDQNPSLDPSTRITVGRLDGTTQQFRIDRLPLELTQQNQLRAAAGLPPLPNLGTVRHGQPAVPGP